MKTLAALFGFVLLLSCSEGPTEIKAPSDIIEFAFRSELKDIVAVTGNFKGKTLFVTNKAEKWIWFQLFDEKSEVRIYNDRLMVGPNSYLPFATHTSNGVANIEYGKLMRVEVKFYKNIGISLYEIIKTGDLPPELENLYIERKVSEKIIIIR